MGRGAQGASGAWHCPSSSSRCLLSSPGSGTAPWLQPGLFFQVHSQTLSVPLSLTQVPPGVVAEGGSCPGILGMAPSKPALPRLGGTRGVSPPQQGAMAVSPWLWRGAIPACTSRGWHSTIPWGLAPSPGLSQGAAPFPPSPNPCPKLAQV